MVLDTKTRTLIKMACASYAVRRHFAVRVNAGSWPHEPSKSVRVHHYHDIIYGWSGVDRDAAGAHPGPELDVDLRGRAAMDAEGGGGAKRRATLFQLGCQMAILEIRLASCAVARTTR